MTTCTSDNDVLIALLFILFAFVAFCMWLIIWANHKLCTQSRHAKIRESDAASAEEPSDSADELSRIKAPW